VVSHGTLAEQQVVCATLATLADAVARAGLQSPCLTIVGEVVRLREELAWFGAQGAGVEAAQDCPGLPLPARPDWGLERS
jgi:hypothetical protein